MTHFEGDVWINSTVHISTSDRNIVRMTDRSCQEWGMRSFQAASFPRIKDRIVYEETGERKLILKILVLLLNYRANKVGISQIRNTYMTPLDRLRNYATN